MSCRSARNNRTMVASATRTLLLRRAALSRRRCPGSKELACGRYICHRVSSGTSCAAASGGSIHPTRPFHSSPFALSCRRRRIVDAHCIARLDSYGGNVSPAALVAGRYMLDLRHLRRPFSSSSSGEHVPRPDEAAGVAVEEAIPTDAIAESKSTRLMSPRMVTIGDALEGNAALEALGTNPVDQPVATLSSSSTSSVTLEPFGEVEPLMPLLEEPLVDPYEATFESEMHGMVHEPSSETATTAAVSDMNIAPTVPSVTNKSTTLFDDNIGPTTSMRAPNAPNDANDDRKAVILKQMIDSAESSLHRMLTLADDLYEEEEERHNQMERDGGDGPKRHNRRPRAPLRDRVENMTERRKEENSSNGAEERRMRLERRRRQWEAAAAVSDPNEMGNEVEENGEVIEGLGRKADLYQPSVSAPMFGDETNLRTGDVVRMADGQSVHAGIGISSDTFQENRELGGVESPDTKDGELTVPKSTESHPTSFADLLDSGSMDVQTFGVESSAMTTDTHTASPVCESRMHDVQSTEGSNTIENPALMDLLGDDFTFSTKSSDDSPKPVKTSEEKGRSQPPSSLMDLLNENFNVPLAERNDDEIHLETESRPPGSLMDLLSENFSTPPKPNQMPLASYISDDNDESSAEAVPVTKSFGLLGLLDVDAEGDPADTPVQEETYPSSLMDLLDDDEQQVNAGDATSFEFDCHLSTPNKPEITDNSNTSTPSSLLDLMNEDAPTADADLNHEDASNASLDTANPQISNSTSLFDLMSDDTDKSDTLVGLLGTDDDTDIWDSDDMASDDMANVSDTVDELLSLLICASQKEWREISNTSEPSLLVEAEREFGFSINEDDEILQTESMVSEDILSESSELTLSTDELNLALLNLAMMTPTLQTMELMIKLFKHMEDNRRAGNVDASPNAATYTLLMVTFGDRGNDHQAAKFVCERMMDATRKSGLELDNTSVTVGARCLKKAGDISNAEKLLSESLGESGSGVEVSPGVFRHALTLYKEDNLQEDALKLLDVFITETGIDGSERSIDDFVKSLIRWPQRNRRGNRIATALHHQNILEYIETHCVDRNDTYGLGGSSVNPTMCYLPSQSVWRELLRSLFRAAKQESKGQYELVRRACRCLVNSSREETHPDHFVLQAGLTAAEALGDAKLASDMILWAWENAEQFVETASHSHWSSHGGGDHSSEFSDGEPLSSFGMVTGKTEDDNLDAELDSLFGSTNPCDSDSSGGAEERKASKLGDEERSNLLSTYGPANESSSGLLSLLESGLGDDSNGEEFFSGASGEDLLGSRHEHILDSDWTHSEHESGPPQHFIHIPTKAYYSAIKICLARGEPELAHAVLKAGCVGPSEDVDMRLPDSSRSHLFNLVMSGYSQVGDFENSQSLLDEMLTNGPRPTEHTYAAFITSLAMANKVDEASNVIDSMLSNANCDGIVPGSSSFSACMLAALKAKRWQQVLDLNTKMIDAGILPNSQSYFGVVLASTRLGDRASALKAAESALDSELPINHQGLNLLLKALLPDSFGDGSIASVRSNLRSLGKQNKDLVVAANALSRSLRMVETEERRPKRTKDLENCEKMWQTCLRDLCVLVHQKDVL